MGTWYEIRSQFVAKPGTTAKIVARLIQDCRRTVESESLEFDHDVTVQAQEGRMVITLNFAQTCSYSFAEQIDQNWIHIVTTLADFKVGPVVVKSGGEDYDDSGPLTWFIGPARLVLDSRIMTRKEEIRRLQAELVQWQRQLRNVGNHVKVVRP
jgi:hypothetical protein